MKYFIDTEFNEKPGLLELISIGVVSEDSREYYAVSSEWKRQNCNEWVKDNVLPFIRYSPNQWKSNRDIAHDIASLVNDDPNPIFVGYYCDYDWVLFCWLFGTMMDLPRNFPMYCIDLKQELDILQVEKPELPSIGNHNALVDAIWIKDCYIHLLNKGSKLWTL
jgi:hypothetical protein